MPNKHCAHSLCPSDSRYHPNIKWAKFVQPNVDLTRCQRWVHLCGRLEFETKDVKPWTFICEKHFPRNANLDYHRVRLFLFFHHKQESGVICIITYISTCRVYKSEMVETKGIEGSIFKKN